MDESPRDLSALQSEPWESVLRLAKGFRPWRGQLETWRQAWVTSDPRALIVLPTGYGKTEAALGVYAILRARGIVNRLLWLGSTDLQRDQLAGYHVSDIIRIPGSLEKAAQNLGITMTGDPMPMYGYTRELRYHRDGDNELFVSIYPALALGDISHYLDLLLSGQWMVVYDEAHRLADYGAETPGWANSSHKLKPRFALYASATPIRSDRQPLKGVPLDPVNADRYQAWPGADITAIDAIGEGALRPPESETELYEITVQVPGQTKPKIISAATLRQEGAADTSWSEYEIRWQLRYTTEYVSPLIRAAWTKLQANQSRHFGQHQMLVFAMSNEHARITTEQLNALEPNCAEWIGVRRPPEVNRQIMTRFLGNELPILVQVDKAGEGFNNCRCSVLLFLHLINADTKLLQQIGRGLRRNHELPRDEDSVTVYAGADTPVAAMVQKLAAEARAARPEPPRPRPRRDDEPELPVWSVLNVEHTGTESQAPHGAAVTPDIVAAAHQAGITTGQVLTILKFFGYQARPLAELTAPAPTSEQVLLQKGSAKVKLGTNRIVDAVLRRWSGPVPSDAAGAIVKALHTQWIRQTGRGHDAMKGEEYHAKYAWLQQVHSAIVRTSEIPTWLVNLGGVRRR